MATRRFLGLLCAAGAFALAAPIVIDVTKAWAGQRLMERAYEKAALNGETVRPWSRADFALAGELTLGSGERLLVADRASGEALAWAPGLVQTGVATVIAGHRDTHFIGLKTLKRGDVVRWSPLGGRSRIFSVVEAERLSTPEFIPWAGVGPVLHLATCAPNRPGDRAGRLVVTALPMAEIDASSYGVSQSAVHAPSS